MVTVNARNTEAKFYLFGTKSSWVASIDQTLRTVKVFEQ
jgi:hypothetical protein